MHTILQGKRLIAFDLDGTLIDSVPDLAVGVQRALQEVGLAQPSEDRCAIGWATAHRYW